MSFHATQKNTVGVQMFVPLFLPIFISANTNLVWLSTLILREPADLIPYPAIRLVTFSCSVLHRQKSPLAISTAASSRSC